MPEKSDEILADFFDCLDRVIRQCRSCADHREIEFINLRARLKEVDKIAITTAAALRSAPRFVEELILIDQPKFAAQQPYVQLDAETSERLFTGILRLSQREAKGLARSVKILDAVIRNRDHSDSTVHSWIGHRTQPLMRLVREGNGSHPVLCLLLLERENRGITCNFEMLVSELVQIWSSACGKQLDLEQTRNLLGSYFPVASQIGSHDQMAAVFETARKHVAEAKSV